MRKEIKIALIAILVLLVIIAGIITYFIYQVKSSENGSSNSCIDLGCQTNAIYVGSINSDKYYLCDCRYAGQINPENIICFVNDNDAQTKGYVKSEC